MIEVVGLSKRYGGRCAVDGATFSVHPGRVTGFLGPNGAGKSTTMRMILELVRPSSGLARIEGKALHEHPDPLRRVGSLIDTGAMHPGRTATNHLRALAATHRIPRSRVDEVISLAGLDAVTDARVRTFSLGMRQRLGLAAALLGDPGVLILDEPSTGLDADGIRWLRHLVRQLAGEGRTVFLSSHLMSEVATAVDQVIVIGRGRVLVDAPLGDVVRRSAKGVRVVAADPATLRRSLEARGATVTPAAGEALEVAGMTAIEVGEIALRAGIALSELGVVQALESAYFELTEPVQEHRAGALS